jgi:hypothetical protein
VSCRASRTFLLATVALVLPGNGAAASEQLPGLARGTALCPPPTALRFEVGSWSEPRPGSPHEFFAAVWTRGGRGAGGIDVYASITPTASRISQLCRRIAQRGVSSTASLRAPLSYRMTDSGNAYFVDSRGAVTPGSPHLRSLNPLADRNAVGITFECNVAQRVVVHARPLNGQAGHYLSVRTQRSRKLLALAVLRPRGESLLRVGKGCQRV